MNSTIPLFPESVELQWGNWGKRTLLHVERLVFTYLYILHSQTPAGQPGNEALIATM